ncbi:MAG: methyltransferase domain-containing protein [Chitinophagaceae bacterium]|nr:methyltransferase domain-containing protein [Chitinophagaceae bacterium]
MIFPISELNSVPERVIKATTDLASIPNEAFDIVFSAHVLEHHPHPKTMIEDIYSKLKKGERILVIP